MFNLLCILDILSVLSKNCNQCQISCYIVFGLICPVRVLGSIVP